MFPISYPLCFCLEHFARVAIFEIPRFVCLSQLVPFRMECTRCHAIGLDDKRNRDTVVLSTMSTYPVESSSYNGKFHSALRSIPLEDVDLETLEHLERSSELDHYLDPAAPNILYTLVQTRIKSKPGYAVRSYLIMWQRNEFIL